MTDMADMTQDLLETFWRSDRKPEGYPMASKMILYTYT